MPPKILFVSKIQKLHKVSLLHLLLLTFMLIKICL